MGLETATTISSLDEDWPVSGDPVSEGDNHLRIIKDVLKLIFPGSGGVGFAIPITATEAEINTTLDGCTVTAAQLNSLQSNLGGKTLAGSGSVIDNFATGTIMLFHQSAAPTGWTKDTASTYDNHALRVVTSTSWVAADSTGSSFTTIFGSGKVTSSELSTNIITHGHADTFDTANEGAHTHSVPTQNDSASGGGGDIVHVDNDGTAVTTGVGSAHKHTITGAVTDKAASGTSHSHDLSLDIDYISLIRATKDAA